MNTRRKQQDSSFKALLMGLTLGAIGGMTGMYLYLREQPRSPDAQQVSLQDCTDAAQVRAQENNEAGREAKDYNFYGVLENAPVSPTRPDLEAPPVPPTMEASASTQPKVVAKPAPPTVASVPAPPPTNAPLPGPPPSAPSTTPQSGPVYLQLASFKTTQDADALKARLVLAGQSASVVSMDLPDKGTFYRVRVGPFTDKDEALDAANQMQDAGIDPRGAILVR